MTQVAIRVGSEAMVCLVLQNEATGKFHVILRDSEAGETVACTICPTIELAMTYFQKYTQGF